jgi:hypothetical protein
MAGGAVLGHCTGNRLAVLPDLLPHVPATFIVRNTLQNEKKIGSATKKINRNTLYLNAIVGNFSAIMRVCSQ